MMAILVEASIRAALVAGVIGLVLAVLRVRAGGVRHRRGRPCSARCC